MSDYTPIKKIILESELTLFRYNERFDSYSFFLKNDNNTLVDIVLIFTFGNISVNQIMITLNNSKIYFELALSDVEKHIPLIHYQVENKVKKTFFHSLWAKKIRKKVKEVMTFDEFILFLDENKIQRVFRSKLKTI
ncbi:MAG: hypothetical protein A2015_14920 [Spirochaetes bacterium GWF1_31_7]|nr:MAG: hypothetical protein A2Y30_12180 [Spirochaetes bacterium GWE1_32_154]OHD49440.1 MAG: hypothetical protein A2015_14920 [Spirochaetes bacterium GWF1_31_7]OHD52026.1 MAG: hypothetical protein A2Y29_14960 [Spirochaetes bacterium GWE2_31_10]OHD75469.1 MAG: hypothetical protein A2355_05905 [Spirochaetes bacterium RIFOXYB1_FULL_32_8]HBD93637.1 hypothetical protein [Spirochaetia bacterium]